MRDPLSVGIAKCCLHRRNVKLTANVSPALASANQLVQDQPDVQSRSLICACSSKRVRVVGTVEGSATPATERHAVRRYADMPPGLLCGPLMVLCLCKAGTCSRQLRRHGATGRGPHSFEQNHSTAAPNKTKPHCARGPRPCNQVLKDLYFVVLKNNLAETCKLQNGNRNAHPLA